MMKTLFALLALSLASLHAADDAGAFDAPVALTPYDLANHSIVPAVAGQFNLGSASADYGVAYIGASGSIGPNGAVGNLGLSGVIFDASTFFQRAGNGEVVFWGNASNSTYGSFIVGAPAHPSLYLWTSSAGSGAKYPFLARVEDDNTVSFRAANDARSTTNPWLEFKHTSSTVDNMRAKVDVVFDVAGRGVRFGSTTGPLITGGAGSPEGALAAPVGSLYLRSDGGAGTTQYTKESGTGNTGWVAK